eukprot:COSAG06_NODE_7951_length_2324_cov_84.087640_2_plen_226_part_00
MLDTDGGNLRHAGRTSDWEGMPQWGEIKQGDVVGLLLDLGQRTLSVYLNGARRGVMVAPGMKNVDDEVVAPLAGPLRWAVNSSGLWWLGAHRAQAAAGTGAECRGGGGGGRVERSQLPRALLRRRRPLRLRFQAQTESIAVFCVRRRFLPNEEDDEVNLGGVPMTGSNLGTTLGQVHNFGCPVGPAAENDDNQWPVMTLQALGLSLGGFFPCVVVPTIRQIGGRG